MYNGILGLGGLGHLAVKFANAFGVKVIVISTSSSKRKLWSIRVLILFWLAVILSKMQVLYFLVFPMVI